MEAMVKNSFMRLFQIFLMNILCFIDFSRVFFYSTVL